MPVPSAALLLVAAALALVGCRRGPQDPVSDLLRALETAAEARDADAFAERLSADFQTVQGQRKADVIAELRRDFALYESVALEVYGVESERNEGSARVRCVVEFSGKGKALPGGLAGFLPPGAIYRFELDVADEGGSWRVRNANWAAVEPTEPPVPSS